MSGWAFMSRVYATEAAARAAAERVRVLEAGAACLRAELEQALAENGEYEREIKRLALEVGRYDDALARLQEVAKEARLLLVDLNDMLNDAQHDDETGLTTIDGITPDWHEAVNAMIERLAREVGP